MTDHPAWLKPKKHRRKRRRRALLRLAVFAGALALLLGAGLYAASRLLAPERIVAQLQTAVAEQTGRRLTISGRPRIRFWPELSVSLGDVTLSDPPGMGEGVFARIGRLDIAVPLRPLLARRLIIRRLDLAGVRLTLRVDEKGRVNWAFAAGTSGGDGAFIEQLRLAPIRIRDVQVRYVDARSGKHHAIDHLDMTIRLPTPQSPLKVTADAVLRKQPVVATLFIAHPARLTGRGSAVEAVLKTPLVKASYAGLLRLHGGLTLAGRLEATGGNLRALLRWIGGTPAKGRGLKAWAVKAAVDYRGDRLRLKKLQGRLDGMRAQGDLTLRLGNVPHISAALGVDRIDVNAYLDPSAELSRRPGTWSQAPLDFSPLRGLNADLRLNSNAILYRKVKTGPAVLRVRLKAGRLEAVLQRLALYGGAASGRLTLNGGGKKPSLDAALTLKGVDAFPLLRDAAGITRIIGAMNAEIDVSASGRSQLEMIGQLAGKATFRLDKGHIAGLDLVRMARDVRRTVLTGWLPSRDAGTRFATLAASFAIRDGIAQTKDLTLIAPALKVSGAGAVDLLRRRLDLRVDPKLTDGGAEQALPVAIIIRGPWARPRVYPDIEGVLKNPDAAYKRLQSLLKNAGASGATQAVDNVKKAAEQAVRDKEKALRDKAKNELKKVLGEKKANETVEKAGQKVQDLLNEILR